MVNGVVGSFPVIHVLHSKSVVTDGQPKTKNKNKTKKWGGGPVSRCTLTDKVKTEVERLCAF